MSAEQLSGGDRMITHVRVNGLRFSYPGQESVLEGVDLEVLGGEKIGLIGPNGSGKTTLFMLLAGVLTPDAGSVDILGSSVTPGRFNPDLGFVFQNPDDQLFCPTVMEDVEFGLLNRGFSAGESRSMAETYLGRTGMLHLSQRPPHDLSGGEKRMVSIAGVMIMEPAVVILDEPESSLDGRSRRMLIEFLKRTDETMMIASHDLEFLLEVCGRTVMLDGGTISADGPSREIMGDRELMEAHGFEKPHSLVPHADPHHQ
ncbi:MAG: ABC transporter ATP-binding protein [Candidatus Fermentibacteraceae bacterium]|nr:ABC transporter ATP-binding protein [Candidatus Fermentibacteraceae bacterium]